MANDKKDRVSTKNGEIGEEEKKKARETALSQIEKRFGKGGNFFLVLFRHGRNDGNRAHDIHVFAVGKGVCH